MGKLWVNYLKTLKKLSICLLGNTSSAPSATDVGDLWGPHVSTSNMADKQQNLGRRKRIMCWIRVQVCWLLRCCRVFSQSFNPARVHRSSVVAVTRCTWFLVWEQCILVVSWWRSQLRNSIYLEIAQQDLLVLAVKNRFGYCWCHFNGRSNATWNFRTPRDIATGTLAIQKMWWHPHESTVHHQCLHCGRQRMRIDWSHDYWNMSLFWII